MASPTLLERAHQLMQRPAAAAGIMIVPLALAATAQAGAVTFTVDNASVKNISGGILGSAYANPAVGSGLTRSNLAALWGAITPIAASGLDGSFVYFHWDGTASGSVQAGDLVSLLYDFTTSIDTAAGTDGQSADHTPDELDWTLSYHLYDDAAHSHAVIDQFTSGLGPAHASGHIDGTFASATTLTGWEVNLEFEWYHGSNGLAYGNDVAHVDIPSGSTLDLQYVGDSTGPSAVPVPAAVWLGLPLLLTLPLLTRRVRRRPA